MCVCVCEMVLDVSMESKTKVQIKRILNDMHSKVYREPEKNNQQSNQGTHCFHWYVCPKMSTDLPVGAQGCRHFQYGMRIEFPIYDVSLLPKQQTVCSSLSSKRHIAF